MPEAWRCVVVVITTAQLHSTKPELRFCAVLNPTRDVSEIRNGEDYLTIVPVKVAYKRRVLKHFAEEKVCSVQLASIGTFRNIKTLLFQICMWIISIIQRIFLNFHVWFLMKSSVYSKMYQYSQIVYYIYGNLVKLKF